MNAQEIGTQSLVLPLEALHIFFLMWTLMSSVGFPIVASSGLDQAFWVVSGTVSGFLNFHLFRRRSKIISSLGLETLFGVALLLSSRIAELSSHALFIRIFGLSLMSSATICAILAQLQNCEQLFLITTEHATMILLTSFLSPLLVIETSVVGSLLPTFQTTTVDLALNARNFIEGYWIKLYPYTIALFVVLATQPFWLHILAASGLVRPQTRLESPASRETSRMSNYFRCSLILVAIAVGVIVSSSRLRLGYPLTGDAQYYLSVLQQMSKAGSREALSTDRPLLFLILHSLRTFFSIDAESFLKHSQIGLTVALITSTYFFVSSCFKNEGFALLSAFLASASPHLTVGIEYFIIGNWVGLVMMMIFCTTMLRSIEVKSRAWTISAISISWLMFGIHFPTWAFTLLVLITYTFISFRRSHADHGLRELPTIRITVGYLLVGIPAFLFALGAADVSSSLQNAWLKTADYLIRLTPVNIALFLRDEVLLSSYFAHGSYAIPLMYGLASFGLYRTYCMRGRHSLLIFSWAGISSLGILIIPVLEQWRLLYMMPLEILAAIGFYHVLMSVGLLKESSVVNVEKKMWLRGAVLICSLLLGAAIVLGTSASPLLVVSSLMVVGLFLVRNLNPEQSRQIVATESVLLYVLANVARALCALR